MTSRNLTGEVCMRGVSVERGGFSGVVGFGGFYYFIHHVNDEVGVFSDSGFGGEHQMCCSIEDGVGDVADLGPCGDDFFGHAVEHLRGDDYGFIFCAGFSDNFLLEDWDVVNGNADSEVASGDDDTIGFVDD